MIEIELLPAQRLALQATQKKVLMLGGIGTGKTKTLAMQALNWHVEYPRSKYMICANTFTQLLTSTIPSVTELLDQYQIPYDLSISSTKKLLTINGTRFYLYSLKNYENMRGIEVGGILADELPFAKREAYDTALGRLREKQGPLHFRGYGSPNGFNWCYDEWGGIIGGTNRGLIQAKTNDNIFLPDGYYEDLVGQYGGLNNPLAKQELLGEFINLTAGAIYWGFDRGVNVKPVTPNKRMMTYVGQDFNVDPMCNICVQMEGDTYYVFKENVLPDSNSYEASEHLRKTLGSMPFSVIPDSTGKSRKTSSARGATDLQIFRDAGITLMPSYNPLIRDRQNNLNLKLQQGKIIIDPSCKNLINELETLSSRDKEGDVSHVAVALGYVIWKLQPLRATNSRGRSYTTQL